MITEGKRNSIAQSGGGAQTEPPLRCGSAPMFARPGEPEPRCVVASYGVLVLGLAVLLSVRRAGLSVAVANMVYTAAAILLLALGFPLAASGVLFTPASAVYTMMIGGLQYLAWRHVRRQSSPVLGQIASLES
jgi:hypothetical protein